MLLVSPVRWWVLALMAVGDLVFGLVVVVAPIITVINLVYAFACLVVFDGLVAGAVSLRERHFLQRWWLDALIGLINLGLGAFILWYQFTTGPIGRDFLSVFVGSQALFQGSLSFGVSLEMNRVAKVRGAFLFYGLLSIAGGILVLAAPYVTLVDLFALIATYAIVAALGLALDALRLRRLAR